jgi:hypothetical protein
LRAFAAAAFDRTEEILLCRLSRAMGRANGTTGHCISVRARLPVAGFPKCTAPESLILMLSSRQTGTASILEYSNTPQRTETMRLQCTTVLKLAKTAE